MLGSEVPLTLAAPACSPSLSHPIPPVLLLGDRGSVQRSRSARPPKRGPSDSPSRSYRFRCYVFSLLFYSRPPPSVAVAAALPGISAWPSLTPACSFSIASVGWIQPPLSAIIINAPLSGSQTYPFIKASIHSVAGRSPQQFSSLPTALRVPRSPQQFSSLPTAPRVPRINKAKVRSIEAQPQSHKPAPSCS